MSQSPTAVSLPAHVTIATRCREPIFADEAVALNVFLLIREHPLTLAAVVMPDHLHWLLADGTGLPGIVRRFKSFSTERAWAAGHEGRLWQRSFFDGVVRTEEMLRLAARYLLSNPVAARLAATWSEYPWTFLHPSLAGHMLRR
jgi:REP element-mobilizing transposase RayT